MTNGATNIKKGVAELHKLLPRCKDHPALVDEGAKAEALLLTLLVVELVVVEVMSVDVKLQVSAMWSEKEKFCSSSKQY